MKSFFLKTFGCKVNQYDGQVLRERLEERGMQSAPSPEDADLLVLNFCVVTSRSASRCFRALSGLAKRNLKASLLVAGCLSPEDRFKVKKAFPRALFLSSKEDSPWLNPTMDPRAKELPWDSVRGLFKHTRAFIKVQDGCNLKCAYCIIPSLRGQERSRPLYEISEEMEGLIRRGYKELVLCGIRLGGYRWKGITLDQLLYRLLKSHGEYFRIRLSSLNPAEVTHDLLEVIRRDERIAPHLHISLQSGDSGVLKRMKRPYSPDQFLKKVAEIREVLTHPALTTDLMVGFPGEDDAAFENSLQLLEKARLARVHVFPYSPRNGTEAAGFHPVPDGMKNTRTRQALHKALKLKENFDRACIGRQEKVLIETSKDKILGLPMGLTSRYQKTAIKGLPPSLSVNTFAEVFIEDHGKGFLWARSIPGGSHET